jgi:ribose/xylose/arabinose/galactoside ABC-type transport system permease subunit
VRDGLSRILDRRGNVDAADLAIPGVLLAGCIVLTFSTDTFFTSQNLANVLEQVSLIGIIALATTMLLISGNFDLSVGGIVALSGVLSAQIMNAHGLVIGIVAALAIGSAFGAFNGFLVTTLKVNSLVATLGTGFAFSGLALLAGNSSPVAVNSADLPDIVGSHVVGVSLPAVVFIVAIAISAWLLHFTVGGRQLYAVGANSDAARYAGIRVDRVRFMPFVASGLCCGVATVLLLGQLQSALPDAAQTWPLQVVAAAVVGGVSIAGGRGTILMAVVGVLLIGVVNNGFNLLNLESSWQDVFTGAILVTAVAVDSALRARARRRSARSAAVASDQAREHGLTDIVRGSQPTTAQAAANEE